MATKKFIIEVEEGVTECSSKCPFHINFLPMCNGAPNGLNCSSVDLATMKIKELEEGK